jgi:ubiquinone/menaquinone biosynthesis C-methylase UbiE
MSLDMKPADAEFDQYDRSYQKLVEDSMNFSGMSHDYVTKVKADLIIALAKERFGSLENRRILDVGCGVGLSDTFLIDQPWKVYGSDVSAKSVEQARQRNPAVEYAASDGSRLPYDDGSFDVCFTICVMHHVPPPAWTDFLREMRRVLKPEGIALVLEHNPLNPLTRLVVNRCPFDADAVLLSRRTLLKHLREAQLSPQETRYFLFTPWEKLRVLDRVFGRVPLGAQYCTVSTR